MRIAIMQPYFYPYAGYFRLLYSADIFVALDCVQFPRRGWVHRNQLHDQTGQRNWISLPLLKSNRDTTRICDLKFNSDAKKLFLDQSRRFPCLTHIERTNHSLLICSPSSPTITTSQPAPGPEPSAPSKRKACVWASRSRNWLCGAMAD